jgi:hypothetical protein
VGRVALPKPVSQHWREILRAIRRHTNAYGNCNANNNANLHCYVDADGYIYTKADSNSKEHATGQAAPNSGAAAVARDSQVISG